MMGLSAAFKFVSSHACALSAAGNIGQVANIDQREAPIIGHRLLLDRLSVFFDSYSTSIRCARSSVKVYAAMQNYVLVMLELPPCV
jgi:hypothetical protein